MKTKKVKFKPLRPSHAKSVAICPRCSGSGGGWKMSGAGSVYDTCPTCEGHGKVEVELINP